MSSFGGSDPKHGKAPVGVPQEASFVLIFQAIFPGSNKTKIRAIKLKTASLPVLYFAQIA